MYLCNIHHVLPDDASVLSCGHLACTECIAPYLDTPGAISCPECSAHRSSIPQTQSTVPIPQSPSRNLPQQITNRYRDDYLRRKKLQEQREREEELRRLEEIPTIKDWESDLKREIKQRELAQAKREREETRNYLKEQKLAAHREREGRIRKQRGLPPKEISTPTSPSPLPYYGGTVRVQVRIGADSLRREFDQSSTIKDIERWVKKKRNYPSSIRLRFFQMPRIPVKDCYKTLQELNMSPAVCLVVEADGHY
ncbi:hypothetical protein P9112_000565 [Eukaryota sp. TZLM1-RC]